MRVTESPPELANLLFARKAHLIAIDGAHGSGKSTLAKYIAGNLGASLIEVDQFLRRNQDAYMPNLDYEAIARKVDPQRPCILEGICIRQVAATAGLTPDVNVYVKRTARWGWADEDRLVFEGSVEGHLERMKQDALRFFDAGEQPRLGLWEEVIPYHAQYRPQETCDFVYLRIDTGRLALSKS